MYSHRLFKIIHAIFHNVHSFLRDQLPVSYTHLDVYKRQEVSIVNTGVAITRILQEHPVNINTFASEIVLPSFERMDEVAVLNVLGE